MKTFNLFFLLLVVSSIATAQEMKPELEQLDSSAELESLAFDHVFEKIVREEVEPTVESAETIDTIRHVRVMHEFYYVVILSVLCLFSLSIVLFFLLKLKQDALPKDIVSSAGLILIVFGTIILVLIVDTSEQLTAAIGILGAIAGYLFRSAQEPGAGPQQNSSQERQIDNSNR